MTEEKLILIVHLLPNLNATLCEPCAKSVYCTSARYVTVRVGYRAARAPNRDVHGTGSYKYEKPGQRASLSGYGFPGQAVLVQI